MTPPRHFFLQPSLRDPAYVCGGWQIFNRAAELVGRLREVETLTYRHREEGARYLDDVPATELAAGIVWVSWQSHVIELGRRLAGAPRVVLYAQNTDFGPENGQRTPPEWPIVALSRHILADTALHDPGRAVFLLPPVLHPAARNPGGPRDLEVLVHRRKTVPYVREELIPALREHLAVEVVDRWLPQEDFLAFLGRTKVYLYWTHRQTGGVLEGFGLQPLEAIACGALPVSNVYGGLADYLEPPWSCLQLGVASLAHDVARIRRAVAAHDGHNPDEERVRVEYSEERFLARFERIEDELLFHFAHAADAPPTRFALGPPPPPLLRRPYEWAYRQWHRWRRRLLGVLPR